MKQVDKFKIAAIASCLSLMVLTLVPKAHGDEWNKKTSVTFSGPVEIPGVGAQTLPAGTYIFKLLDSSSDRNIVQILNADETHVYSTVLAIPDYRLKPTGKTVMTFKERAEGQPEAVRAWFYPGSQWGQEFVYPKSVAVVLAKVTNEPILAMPVETEPTVTALKEVQVEAVKPTGEEVPVAEVVEAPPIDTAALEPAPAEKSLPHTASLLPLVGLVGLLSLGAGFALTVIPKRNA